MNAALLELKIPEISGWRLPTLAELEYIGKEKNYENINDKIKKLNESLTDKIKTIQISGNSYFYDDGEIKSYNVVTNRSTTITNGKTSILRAFATLTFTN